MSSSHEVNGDVAVEEHLPAMIEEPGQSNAGELPAANRDRDSSESTPSDHSSIYLATRASSGIDGSQRYSVDDQIDDMLDTDLASMAMFVSLMPAPAASHVSQQDRNIGGSIHKGFRSPWRRLQLRSETYRQPRKGASLTNHSTSEIDRVQTFTRKTLSLDDARAPTWMRSLTSPVGPLRPKYPPPTRSPTPPGLPSFGSREAADCARGFLGRPPTGPQRPPRESLDPCVATQDSDASRRGSYGERIQNFFREIFAASTPVNNQPSGPAVTPIGRADDGTAVQGRFPYRHSGHGTNLARCLEDHPFHQATGDTNDRSHIRHRHSNGEHADAKIGTVSGSRPSRTEPRANRLQSPTSPATATLPSIPEPAVTANSRPKSTPRVRHLPQRVSPQSPPAPRYERRSFPAECAGRGFLDGSGADDSPTSTQPPAISPMEAAASDDEPFENQARAGFWATTWEHIRESICCPMWNSDDDSSIPLSTPAGSNTSRQLQGSRSNFVAPPSNSNRQTRRRCSPLQVFYAPAYGSDLTIEPVAA